MRKQLGLNIREFSVLVTSCTHNKSPNEISDLLDIDRSVFFIIIKKLKSLDYCNKVDEYYRFSENFYRVINSGFVATKNLRVKRKKDVFVYLMQDEHTGLYKIGKSSNLNYRERTLAAQIPKIKMIHSFLEGENNEKQLHKKYQNKRIRGEWFNLTQEDVQDIINPLTER